MLNTFTLFLLFILISGFSSAQESTPAADCLLQLEEQSRLIKACQVNQVLPDACEKYLQPSVLSTLECSQQGAALEQINQAILRGEASVKGNPADSPYEILRKTLLKTPYFITPEKINFMAYSKQCEENKQKLYQMIATSVKDGQAKFILTPLPPTSCLAITNLEKKRPVISPAQLEKLKSGFYLHKQPAAVVTYENIEARIVDSYSEAGDFFTQMSRQVRLTINTVPADAKIKISTIKRPYKKGMKLNVGKYKVQVSSPTYVTENIDVELRDKDSTIDITLISSIETLQCDPVGKNFPVEFVNQYHLQKIDNCSYQIKADPGVKTPLKFLVTHNSHAAKRLLKARLNIVNYNAEEKIISQAEDELAIRIKAIEPGTSGISDIPVMSQSEDEGNINGIIILLDATFSD